MPPKITECINLTTTQLGYLSKFVIEIKGTNFRASNGNEMLMTDSEGVYRKFFGSYCSAGSYPAHIRAVSSKHSQM